MHSVISVHIPKTAGTSFGASLAEAVGGDVGFDYDDKPINHSPEERISSARKHNQMALPIENRVIHGHFLPRKYLYLANSKNCHFITWLREPIARLKSHYRFWRDTPPPAVVPPLRKRMIDESWSFYEFATEPRLQNMYEQFFAEFPLEHFSFIGITERYSQDLARCSEILDLNLTNRVKNKRKSTEDFELTPSELERVSAIHQADISLYQRILTASPQ